MADANVTTRGAANLGGAIYSNSVGGVGVNAGAPDGSITHNWENSGMGLTVEGPTGTPATSGVEQTAAMRVQGTGTQVMDLGVLSNAPYYPGWIQCADKTNLGVQYPLCLNPNGGPVGVHTDGPITDFDVDGQAMVRAGRGFVANRPVPVTHGGTGGAAVFSIDPSLSDEQLAAFCGLTTSEVSWETGSDANDSPGGAVMKFTGLSLSVGGHFSDCGFPMIPIEDAVTSAGVPGRSEGDLSATYYAEMWVKSNNATSAIYAGSSEYEHDFTVVPHHESGGAQYGNTGSYGYWMAAPGWASNTVPGTTWKKMTGYITGFHDDSSGKFESDASYFSPMALINWGATSDASSVMWVSGWKIWKVNKTFSMRCAFKAADTSTTDHKDLSSGAIFPGATAVFNIGGHYNTSTYKFTAPQDGVYQFSWNSWSTSNPDDGYQMSLIVNSSIIFTNGEEGNGECFTTIVVLSAGDTVHLEAQDDINYYAGATWNEFSGHYIGPAT